MHSRLRSPISFRSALSPAPPRGRARPKGRHVRADPSVLPPQDDAHRSEIDRNGRQDHPERFALDPPLVGRQAQRSPIHRHAPDLNGPADGSGQPAQIDGAGMRLTISHRTAYRYARPVALHPHRMMLHPRGDHDLRVVTANLACSPDATLDWAQDVFGNLVATATFQAPAAELVITSQVVADQLSAAWPVLRIAPGAHSFPFAYSAQEIADLGALRAAAPAGPQDDVGSWARAFVMGPPTDTLSLLKDINAGILGAVAYRVRDEEGTQTGAETLAKASGSCRDLAALFIEATRHLGFGARAVSGYLFDPDAPVSDAGTTHAWAEVYLPGAGWVAFDPTHRRMGGANLIPVAVGGGLAAIAPISGGYSGAPEDFLGMEVAVRVTAG